MILQLGELQSITNDLHFNYPNNPSKEWTQHYDKSLLEGWGNIALIEDLSALLPNEFEVPSEELKTVWGQYHTKLGDRSTRSEQEISGKIKELRQSTRAFINRLD